MSKPPDLVQGTLDLLLLKILALQPLHAWAISQRLKQVSSVRVATFCSSRTWPSLARPQSYDSFSPKSIATRCMAVSPLLRLERV